MEKDSLAKEQLDLQNVKTVLGFFGMVAAIVIFVFTTFQTKTDAIKDSDHLEQKVKELHEDFKDMRQEITQKMDRMIERKK